MRPTKLPEATIATKLEPLVGWVRIGDTIARTFELSSFPEAIAFVVRVGFLAEAADHHPDIDVRYRSVMIVLSTHDANGVTELDFALAAQIDSVA